MPNDMTMEEKFRFDLVGFMAMRFDTDIHHPWREHIADKATALFREAIEEAKREGYRSGLEHAASIAEANMHEGPFDPTETLDRVASYSNSTCKLIAAQIRSRGSKEGEGL